ncbi:hypothetical protein PAMP_017834 [Pampus punctatissimus]
MTLLLIKTVFNGILANQNCDPVMPCTPTPSPTHTAPTSPHMPRRPLLPLFSSQQADGALLCLADSDRQELSANSLLVDQLTGLDSARCFYHFRSPSVGGAAADRAEEYRELQQVGDLSADRTMPLSEAPCD